MNLININVSNPDFPVSARDLWGKLESKRQFGNWIQERIEKYGFEPGKDFLTDLLKSTGGRPTKEYHLTVSMAKELAMVENNDKGQQIRKYLISIEEGWNSPERVMARALVIANKTLSQISPKATAFDAVMDAQGLISVWEIGKATIGPNRLFKLLGDRGHFYRQDGHWMVKQSLIKRGLFTMKVKKVEHTQKLYHRIYATPKGESWILQNVVGGVQLEPAL